MEQIPELDFLRFIVFKWWECRSKGQELIIQKSRRLVVSWTMRGCELWSAGIRKEKGVVCGLNYPKAAEHGWRYAFILREMQKRRPEVYKGGHQERGGNFGAQMLEQIILPNGSLIETLNQDGKSFQGSGYSWVSMEEFCLYDHPAYMRGQAKIVTQGKAASKGGFVVSVSNASPSKEWQEIKACTPKA